MANLGTKKPVTANYLNSGKKIPATNQIVPSSHMIKAYKRIISTLAVHTDRETKTTYSLQSSPHRPRYTATSKKKLANT